MPYSELQIPHSSLTSARVDSDPSELPVLHIAELVEGVSKLSGIKFNSRQEKQAENFMKMFLSVAKDLRVIIIKFADTGAIKMPSKEANGTSY